MIRLHHCHQTRSMRVLWLLNERPAFQASLPPEGTELLYARDFYPAWARSGAWN